MNIYIKTDEKNVLPVSDIREAIQNTSSCFYAVCSPDFNGNSGIVWSMGRSFVEAIFNHTGKHDVISAIKEFADMDFIYWNIHPATECLYRHFMSRNVQLTLFVRYHIDENGYANKRY